MCASVYLSLHKFASNSKIGLEAMPIEDRSKDLKDLDLRHEPQQQEWPVPEAPECPQQK